MDSCTKERSLALTEVGRLIHRNRYVWTDVGSWVHVVGVEAGLESYLHYFNFLSELRSNVIS